MRRLWPVVKLHKIITLLHQKEAAQKPKMDILQSNFCALFSAFENRGVLTGESYISKSKRMHKIEVIR